MPPPLHRVLRLGGAGCETNTPDVIIGTGLHQHTISGGEKKFTQVAVLAEFAPVAIQYNGVFELVPYLLVKASYLTAQGLDLLLVAAFQNLVPDLFVAEQLGLGSHHILLHAEVGVSRRIEVLHPPLAEAAFCQLAVLG